MAKILSREMLIVNKLGLHARAAAKLVHAAAAFESEITLCREGREVNGKSIMGVLMLAAGQGASIEISATGDDAEQALDSLEELIRNRFDEPE